MIFCSLWWILQIVAADVAILRKPFNIENNTVNLSIQWIESNSSPKLDLIHNYTLVLCTGPNDKIIPVHTLVWEEQLDRYEKSIFLEDGVYFVQVYARGSDFYTIHYSEKFVVGVSDGFYENPPSSVIHYYGYSTSLDESRIQTAPPFPKIGSKITQNRWTGNKPKPTGNFTDLRSHYPDYDYTILPSVTAFKGRNCIRPAPRITNHYHPSQRIRPAVLRERNE
ncbi:putative cell wall synthesis protein Kre9p [[Candida] jaroonii]|uniref:Cell wall synthesis protein Kre9p n=1 Tax=[Candida] jaroonii TaxID=467808 RepID=A0ACA9YFH2_9ASCO|nr:putative cell wall synthesis protein Kre9p [[Candida] jaroonii]